MHKCTYMYARVYLHMQAGCGGGVCWSCLPLCSYGSSISSFEKKEKKMDQASCQTQAGIGLSAPMHRGEHVTTCIPANAGRPDRRL